MLAQQQAKWLGYAEVGTEHILLGMIADDKGRSGFYGTGVQLEDARQTVSRVSGRRKRILEKGAELPFTRNAKSVFEAAHLESKTMGMAFITPEHICIALCKANNTGGSRVLSALGIDLEEIKAEAGKRLKSGKDAELPKKKATTGNSPPASKGAKACDRFCQDLTRDAANGLIDPVIGREEEIHRVCQILARRKKNNPILLGEPGVGKTAIAAGLALAIATQSSVNGAPLPDMLQGVRVLQLDTGLLLAGAKERGELESRVTKLLAELAEQRGRCILVVDEVHMLVGAGAVGRGGTGGGGGLDIANLLKPALAAGALQCIGATTLKEHRSHIERDPALSRRFQPVMVHEPAPADAIAVLTGLASRYEAHHRVSYTPAAIEAAVALSARYIADRLLPDKALDLLDEAGSRARIQAHLMRAGISDAASEHKLQELMQVMEAKEEEARAGHFEEATLLRERELDLKGQLVAPAEAAASIALVDVPEIERIVAMWTGIPVERMTQTHAQRLSALPAVLGERVIGQPAAIRAVALALQRARCGLKDPKRPIATLLFSGPTGVGKTSLTNELAQELFHSEDAIVRLDMSEYMERHSVSKLVGAPPGYIGFGEGGRLTEAVRRRPYSIVLFDEIEKAHPDVFHILLQVIEDGRLTDSQGRVVSFKDCLIVLTSNVGSQLIARGAHGGLGFQLTAAASETDAAAEEDGRVHELVLEELKGCFRPEFLNRLDEIVVFSPLRQASVRAIANRMLAETTARVAARGVTLRLTEAAVALLCGQGFHVDQGARQLRRTITSLVEDTLSEYLLSRTERSAGEPVVMDVCGDTLAIVAPSDATGARELDARMTGQGVELLDVLEENGGPATPLVPGAVGGGMAKAAVEVDA